MPQFNRQAEVVFASLDDVLLPVVRDLRINFRVSKTLKREENSCSVDIYNLSKKSREKIESEAGKLTLKAGYGDPQEFVTERNAEGVLKITDRKNRPIPSIFIGDLTDQEHRYVPPEGITTYTCQRQKDPEVIVSVTFKAGELVGKDILKRIVKIAKLKVREKFEKFIFKNDKKFEAGYTFMGPVKEALDELTQSLKAQWTYQDNVLSIVPLDETDEAKTIFLDSDHGMLGIPEKFQDKENKGSKEIPKKGFIVRSLLLASANPGGRIVLSSKKLELVDADFKIDTVEHVGDNFGAEWGTRMRLIDFGTTLESGITLEPVAGVLA